MLTSVAAGGNLMRIAGLLLAAGAGYRFGGCKQLALIEGRPLVRHALEALALLFDDDLYIVLGAYREDIQPQVEDLAQVISHADWRQGLGSSIARGVDEVEARGRYAGMLIALADQPRISTGDFGQLVERFDGNRNRGRALYRGPRCAGDLSRGCVRGSQATPRRSRGKIDAPGLESGDRYGPPGGSRDGHR